LATEIDVLAGENTEKLLQPTDIYTLSPKSFGNPIPNLRGGTLIAYDKLP
jgi:hypothetical protein